MPSADRHLPQLALYGYQAYDYYIQDKTSFFIHDPVPGLSTAENILHMLRPDSKFTETEARVLDLALVLHAEHGGGNNSTFTTHVVSSSGTDTYSAIAAALGSLKGPKHGGANIKVVQMFDEIKRQVGDWKDDDEVCAYLEKILHGDAFDHAGLIYGVGHAIYSKSDPRAEIFKSFVHQLAAEKDMEAEYQLYSSVERLAPQIISGERRMYKGVSVNVDFYPASSIRCWASRRSCSPPCLPSPASPAGAPTGWRNWSTATASSAPPIRPFCPGGSTGKLHRDKIQQTLHGLRAN